MLALVEPGAAPVFSVIASETLEGFLAATGEAMDQERGLSADEAQLLSSALVLAANNALAAKELQAHLSDHPRQHWKTSRAENSAKVRRMVEAVQLVIMRR